jgi:uncharacterized membrane protein
METRRAEAFSDGVFSVAITVLVFGLLPIGAGPRVGHVLLHAWPQYLAYVVSFLTIGIMWLNHHALMGSLREVDRSLLVINLFLLMGVVAVPWPTTLVADHLNGPVAAGGRAATIVYGVVLFAVLLAYTVMWFYIGRNAARIARDPDRPPTRLKSASFMVGLGGYAIGTVVAIFSPGAAVTIYGLVAVYYLFEHQPAQAAKPDAAATGSAASTPSELRSPQ